MWFMEILNEDFSQKIRDAKKTGISRVVNRMVSSYGIARSCIYLFESLSLPIIQFIATGKRPTGKFRNLKKSAELLRSLIDLIEKDAENIAKGLYPATVLSPEAPLFHLLRIPKIWFENLKLARKINPHSDQNQKKSDYLFDIQKHILRNDHKAISEYLSPGAGSLFEHQTEMLMAGGVDAMRRLLLPELKKAFPYSRGEGLKILELGCGTGRLTRFVKLTLPKAKIVAYDISYPSLKKAQQRLKDLERIDFIQGDGSELQFQNEKFDAVVTSFFFHELALEQRHKVIHEAYRVLKPGGLFGLVDSLQKEDSEGLSWAAHRLARESNTPHFMNYWNHSMEGLLQYHQFVSIYTTSGFLAKSVCSRKPEN
jgi:ubiquinone/menaquinone biosynthesis C-methylase UbiE